MTAAQTHRWLRWQRYATNSSGTIDGVTWGWSKRHLVPLGVGVREDPEYWDGTSGKALCGARVPSGESMEAMAWDATEDDDNRCKRCTRKKKQARQDTEAPVLKEAIRVAREHLQELGSLAHQLAASLDHDSPDTGELLDKAAAASSAIIRLRALRAAPPDLTAEWLAIPEHIRAAIRAADKDGRWRVAVHGEEAIRLGLCRAGEYPRHYLTPRAATLRAHAESIGLR